MTDDTTDRPHPRRTTLLLVLVGGLLVAGIVAVSLGGGGLSSAVGKVRLAVGLSDGAKPSSAQGTVGLSSRGSDQRRGQLPIQNGETRRGSGPVVVEIASARAARRSSDIHAIGTLQSDESVQIAPEIAGRIAEIVFEEGKPVKKGQVIIKLDDALVAAEVADTQARLALASANNERARTLSKTGNVTGRGRDEAVANYETAQAAADLAKTRLSKHTLIAPFDAIAGVRSVSIGAYVAAGTAITNLEKIDILKVDFKVPEIHLREIKTGQTVELAVDALEGQTFSATIYAINPMLDVNGRALQVRARLDNKDGRLRPGLFARLTIKGLSERDVVLIPEAAIVPRGSETFVYVIDGSTAVERKVQLGQRANGEVEISEGLDVGARIVTAGQQKLRDGAAIDIVPSAAPPEVAPSLGESSPNTRNTRRPSTAGRSG